MAFFAFFAYFLPASLAAFRRRKASLWILAINALLGWTLIGWIAALVWSFAGRAETDPKPRSKATALTLGFVVSLGTLGTLSLFALLFAMLASAPQAHKAKQETAAVVSATPVSPSPSVPPSSPVSSNSGRNTEPSGHPDGSHASGNNRR